MGLPSQNTNRPRLAKQRKALVARLRGMLSSAHFAIVEEALSDEAEPMIALVGAAAFQRALLLDGLADGTLSIEAFHGQWGKNMETTRKLCQLALEHQPDAPKDAGPTVVVQVNLGVDDAGMRIAQPSDALDVA